MVFNDAREMVASGAERVEIAVTNNVCEYKALILLLHHLMKERLFGKNILIILDSELVTK